MKRTCQWHVLRCKKGVAGALKGRMRCHCEPVCTLVWQSVYLHFSLRCQRKVAKETQLKEVSFRILLGADFYCVNSISALLFTPVAPDADIAVIVTICHAHLYG